MQHLTFKGLPKSQKWFPYLNHAMKALESDETAEAYSLLLAGPCMACQQVSESRQIHHVGGIPEGMERMSKVAGRYGTGRFVESWECVWQALCASCHATAKNGHAPVPFGGKSRIQLLAEKWG